MKGITVLIIFITLAFNEIHSQCPPGYVTLSSQADVDAFVATYPNCTEISGNFIIRNSDNLSGLSQIVSVTGDLEITNCTVSNLNGLNQLSSVGRDMWISGNDNLTNLDGLEQLTEIGDDMNIRSNDKLMDLSGLSQLTTVGGSLIINGNEDMVNLDDLNELQSVGGQLQMRQNANLSTVTGFSQLGSIGTSLVFSDNNNLTEVDGFEILNHIGSNINLVDNNALSEFRLDQLHSVGGNIRLSNAHHALTDIALGNLSIVSGSIIMDFNYDNLTSLSFPKLMTVNSLLIWADELTLIDLPQLLSIETQLRINAEKLTALNTPQITNIGELNIIETQLTDLFNFNHPMSIAGPLTLSDNPLLSVCNVQGICDYLATVGPANAQISNNAQGCNSVGGVFNVGCALLSVELTALNAYTQASSIRLSWQTASESNNQGFEIQRSRDGRNWEKIAWQAGSGTVDNPQNYEYNDTNPQRGTSYYRLKQVDFDDNFEYSHIVSAKYIIDTDFRVSPIPTKDVLYVKFEIQQSNVDIKIINLVGRIIRTENVAGAGFHSKALNIKNLPRGAYFITIGNGGNIQTKRFVKQ